MTDELLLLRWDQGALIVYNDANQNAEDWYIGKVPDAAREHIERAIQNAYRYGRISMQRDIRKQLGIT